MDRKCNKVDYREYVWGIRLAEKKSLDGKLGRVSDLSALKEKVVKEVVAWAGKLSTR